MGLLLEHHKTSQRREGNHHTRLDCVSRVFRVIESRRATAITAWPVAQGLYRRTCTQRVTLARVLVLLAARAASIATGLDDGLTAVTVHRHPLLDCTSISGHGVAAGIADCGLNRTRGALALATTGPAVLGNVHLHDTR